MDRRQLLKLIGLAGASTAALKLTGCGEAPQQDSRLLDGPTRRVLVYDLRMEGWSTLGSGFLGHLTQPLLATQIRDFTDIELAYTQDPHGHRFTLKQAELAKLLLGQQVSVLTTYALDHRHEVRIKPDRRFGTRPPIEVEIDETGKPVGL